VAAGFSGKASFRQLAVQEKQKKPLASIRKECSNPHKKKTRKQLRRIPDPVSILFNCPNDLPAHNPQA
jgi:hypothetical protein